MRLSHHTILVGLNVAVTTLLLPLGYADDTNQSPTLIGQPSTEGQRHVSSFNCIFGQQPTNTMRVNQFPLGFQGGKI